MRICNPCKSWIVAVLVLGLYGPIAREIRATTSFEPGQLPIGVVRVVQARLSIPIENARRSFKVGDRAYLIQENEAFFIALVDRPYGSRQLVAVPVRRGGGKVAWATPEHIMFFGSEVATVDGHLYLRAGEELSVIREDDGRYEVLVERLGKQASIWISKADPGIRFFPNPVLSDGMVHVAGSDTERRVSAALRHDAAQRPKDSTRPSLREAMRREERVRTDSARHKIEHLFPDMDELLISFMLPDVPGLDWEAVESLPPPEDPVLDNLDSLIGSIMATINRSMQILVVVLLSVVFLVVLIIIGLRRSVLKHAHPPSLRKPVDRNNDEAAGSSGADEAAEQQGLGADFSGSVASMSLGAVTQFLNSDKETGVLTVSTGDHKRLGAMVFVEGEIVDALTPKQRGVSAVYDLLKCREGLFAFVRQQQVDTERTVEQGTIALLLDAHRELDEQNGNVEIPEPPPLPPPSKAGKGKSGSLRVKRRADH